MSADSMERSRLRMEKRRGSNTQNIVLPNCRSEERQDIATPRSTRYRQLQP